MATITFEIDDDELEDAFTEAVGRFGEKIADDFTVEKLVDEMNADVKLSVEGNLLDYFMEGINADGYQSLKIDDDEEE